MAAKCPSCGQRAGGNPGQWVSPHQYPGSREACPGGLGLPLPEDEKDD